MVNHHVATKLGLAAPAFDLPRTVLGLRTNQESLGSLHGRILGIHSRRGQRIKGLTRGHGIAGTTHLALGGLGGTLGLAPAAVSVLLLLEFLHQCLYLFRLAEI